MKADRMIELLSRCSPDADVRIYFSEGDYSDSVELVESHVTQYEQSIFLYSFRADEECLKSIWSAEKINVVVNESDFMEIHLEKNK